LLRAAGKVAISLVGCEHERLVGHILFRRSLSRTRQQIFVDSHWGLLVWCLIVNARVLAQRSFATV
jgi:hypothetical protein